LREASASEPSVKCRKRFRRCQNWRLTRPGISSGEPLPSRREAGFGELALQAAHRAPHDIRLAASAIGPWSFDCFSHRPFVWPGTRPSCLPTFAPAAESIRAGSDWLFNRFEHAESMLSTVDVAKSADTCIVQKDALHLLDDHFIDAPIFRSSGEPGHGPRSGSRPSFAPVATECNR
jgi:hypothetical protein